MMMDIVEQLRKSANTIYKQDGYTFRLGLQNEAADEIERLRKDYALAWENHLLHEQIFVLTEAKIERLRERLHNPTPEMIAAAWGAWHERHGGKLGPGPAFVEAMKAMAHAALKEGK